MPLLTRDKISIIQNISLGQTLNVDFVPPEGVEVNIDEFVCQLPIDDGIKSQLLWDGTVIWTMRASGWAPSLDAIQPSETDGVKVLRLSVNSLVTLTPQSVSAKVEFSYG